MPRIPRLKAEHLRKLGSMIGSHVGRGLRAIGNPTTKHGAEIAGAEKLLWAGEIGATGYLGIKAHSISKHLKEQKKNKRLPHGHTFHPVRHI